MGRRRANATYYETHGTDVTTAMIFAMDLTPLIKDSKLDMAKYVVNYINKFGQEVSVKIKKFS